MSPLPPVPVPASAKTLSAALANWIGLCVRQARPVLLAALLLAAGCIWLAYARLGVTTDTSGTARVKVDYPDSLTTWRLTVRAVTAATHVGATTTHSTTTKDLILRVVTPRFLTEGDRVTIPAVVHNYLPDQKTVAVSLEADGLVASDGTVAPKAPRSIQEIGRAHV